MSDKLKIIAFIGGGYSLLPQDKYMIRYMYADGIVAWNRLNVLLQRIANAGAWGWHEFPPWATNHEGWEFLRPFNEVKVNGVRNIVWNPTYFENLAKIFRFSWEQYNLTPIFDLFNGSEPRGTEYDTKLHSPWKVFKDYFYGDDAAETRHQWIDRIIDAAGDIPVWFQQCNEPGPAAKHKAENMLDDTTGYLFKKKFPLKRIITGLDGFRKKKEAGYGKMYNRWKEMVINIIEGDDPFYEEDEVNIKIIKGTMWTPIHGMKNETVSDYFAHGLNPGQDPPPGSWRNTIYSTDAVNPRLTYLQARNLALKIINVKPNAINACRVIIELVVGKKVMADPYAQLEGAASIIKERLGAPENMGKFPKPLPIPSWVHDSHRISKPPVEPEPKSITILSPSLGDTIHVDANDRNLTIGITWKSTGDIEFVDIQYRSNGFLWAFISERGLNESAYEWESTNLVGGKNWIRISDSHGETQATQEFEVEFIWPEAKKMTAWKWLKKHWRWVLGVPSFIAGVLIVALSPSWEWRLGAFLWNFGIAYFGLIRK